MNPTKKSPHWAAMDRSSHCNAWLRLHNFCHMMVSFDYFCLVDKKQCHTVCCFLICKIFLSLCHVWCHWEGGTIKWLYQKMRIQTLSNIVRMRCGQTLGKNEKAVPLVFLDAKCKWPHKFLKCIECIVRHTVYGCLWAKLWISIQPRTAPEAILRRNMLW